MEKRTKIASELFADLDYCNVFNDQDIKYRYDCEESNFSEDVIEIAFPIHGKYAQLKLNLENCPTVIMDRNLIKAINDQFVEMDRKKGEKWH